MEGDPREAIPASADRYTPWRLWAGERMQAAVWHHCMLLWCLFLQFSTRTKTFAGSCPKPMVTNLSSSLLLCHFSPLLLFCLKNSKTKLNINKQYLTDVVLVATSICRVCLSPPPAYICYFDGLFTAVAARCALGVELLQWLVLNDFNMKIIKLTKMKAPIEEGAAVPVG